MAHGYAWGDLLLEMLSQATVELRSKGMMALKRCPSRNIYYVACIKYHPAS